ncbi:ribosomal protection-like ABC-F family protein [Chitinivibrio alkaliphilus]|uniref:ABC transporter ATP-binding protein n=1 Tax=Chitinivibrio alkaliphilus ACht1 TaxID=1313304 RepID=U7DA27_9BACT|nr:ABC-F family ATP-binding cassette domain-containing protein [Chitinivibrio alkaliphilus]ERP39264.1 ABC transporter ATP-binding protein [Chitinivibrio alkaliphilus ACht1]
MNYVRGNAITLSAGNKILLDTASFSIEDSARIGIVGLNGCGKSNFLKTLAGKKEVDSGDLVYNSICTPFLMEQMPHFSPMDTVLDYIFHSFSLPHTDILKEYEYVSFDIAQKLTEKKQERLDLLSAQMDQYGAWDFEGKVRSILHQFGITRLLGTMEELSGGMIKKISLAQGLLSDANLLMLDEPTNHLDIETILWLESYLQRRHHPFIMVTHDRYFLDSVCTHIWEIRDQRIYTYEGNYSYYLEKKEEQLAHEQRKERKRQGRISQEIQWLHRSPSARGTKQKARIARIEEQLKTGKAAQESQASFSSSGRKLGKKIVNCKNAQFGYTPTQPLIQNFSYTFKGGEKIALVGNNGVGKTTFTKLLTGDITPDSGVVDQGMHTAFGIFKQINTHLPDSISVLKYIRSIAEYIEHDGTKISASQFLEQFLFPPKQQHTQIGFLSGGERRRLQLISVLIRNPNFLILDEPTNDLDIETLSVLENFLLDFPGVLLIISHDRYFIDRLCDYLLVMEGDGLISGFPGSYSDYLLWKEEYRRKEQKKSSPVAKKTKQKRFGFKQKRELALTEEQIDTVEEEIQELEAAFVSPEGKDLGRMSQSYAKKKEELHTLMSRWEELLSLQDDASN